MTISRVMFYLSEPQAQHQTKHRTSRREAPEIVIEESDDAEACQCGGGENAIRSIHLANPDRNKYHQRGENQQTEDSQFSTHEKEEVVNRFDDIPLPGMFRQFDDK